MFSGMIRPHIANTVNTVVYQTQYPAEQQRKAIREIISCQNEMKDPRLVFWEEDHRKLFIYVDPNYADGRFVFGFAVMWGYSSEL